MMMVREIQLVRMECMVGLERVKVTQTQWEKYAFWQMSYFLGDMEMGQYVMAFSFSDFVGGVQLQLYCFGVYYLLTSFRRTDVCTSFQDTLQRMVSAL